MICKNREKQRLKYYITYGIDYTSSLFYSLNTKNLNNQIYYLCLNYQLKMGRRNETNRLNHKKKVDQKKTREKDAEQLRKDKLKEITKKFNASNDTKK